MSGAESPVFTVINGCDPLNLGGIIVPGAKTPAMPGNRILLENGVPVARVMSDELEEFPGISQRARRQAMQLLPVVKLWRKMNL